MQNMPEGFFKSFLISLAGVINDNFKDGELVYVKKVRKELDIPSSDRSKIIFIARALQKFKKLGYLAYVEKNSSKKYKKKRDIPVDELKELM